MLVTMLETSRATTSERMLVLEIMLETIWAPSQVTTLEPSAVTMLEHTHKVSLVTILETSQVTTLERMLVLETTQVTMQATT